MEQAIIDDRNYEPKKEDFIDKIPETIPEGDLKFLIDYRRVFTELRIGRV